MDPASTPLFFLHFSHAYLKMGPVDVGAVRRSDFTAVPVRS